MTEAQRAQAQIHFCVLLWGFTAILGKLISLQATALVMWRMALAAIAFALIPATWRGLRAMDARTRLRFCAIGLVVALHWLTFYASIKASNASVAASCMALGSVFAALLEPLWSRRRPAAREISLGLLALPGMWILLGGVPLEMHTGIALGVLSAALTAIFSILNKRHLQSNGAFAVGALEMTAGALFVLPLLWWWEGGMSLPNHQDSLLLILLAVGCTLLPFALSLHALRQLSAFQTQLALNLEPVYAIAIAAVLLGENSELGLRFYLGAGLLCFTVLLAPALWDAMVKRRAG